MNAMSHKAPHTRLHTRACLPLAPAPFTSASRLARNTAPGKQPDHTHYAHRQARAQGTHVLHAGGCRAAGGPQFKARANMSQPHLPGLNGPQSESRNKTKGRLQPLASALPTPPSPRPFHPPPGPEKDGAPQPDGRCLADCVPISTTQEVLTSQPQASCCPDKSFPFSSPLQNRPPISCPLAGTSVFQRQRLSGKGEPSPGMS